jgi:regulator of sigma E protease
MLLAIDWSSVAVKAGQFILSFSILVILHELGHFIPARIFKCRVEKFYLFFNPWFSLWKKKKGETEYGVGWVPFGGYVKISGMIDESMDKEQMKLPPQPYEFRAKKAWQRLIIMLGGVIVNIVLAIVIFIGITWVWGEEYLPAKNVKYGVAADTLSKSIGIKDGDILLSLDNKPIEDYGKLEAQMVLKEVKTVQVQRGDSTISLNVPDGFIKNLIKAKNTVPFAYPRIPVVIDSVTKDAVFTKGKLMKGDSLIAINDKPFAYLHEFSELRKLYIDSIVTLTALRGKDTVSAHMLIKNTAKNKGVSIAFKTPYQILGSVTKKYSFAESIPLGYHRCFQTLGGYITGLKQLFTGKVNANDSVVGIIGIGNTFPGVWDWERFWTLTGIFSIILAFMNVLPIPALDGGHALFTLIEMITGRKPGDKFMEYAQMVGMMLLLGLMAYALGLDVFRLFK